ncbi:MAG: 16S rRNA (cytidine(1402)-2'-O)-methyltransferase [Syntrophobacter sp.]
MSPKSTGSSTPSGPDPGGTQELGGGQLFIVATPIGNLADITLRALETLRAVDLIAAEDTRHTRKLLSRHDIHKPLISYHANNARQRGEELLARIAAGQSIAIVTDAGTPGISDPGFLLIEEAVKRGVEPVAIPGPTALIAALVVSGLSTHPFAFLGFPPPRGSGRRRFFEEGGALAMTLVLYESPKRLSKTLNEILDAWGDRRIAVVRELTKVYEEVYRGLVSEALAHFGEDVRGELTLIVEGGGSGSPRPPLEAGWEDELSAMLDRGAPSKEAASVISTRFGIPRRTAYQAALKLRKS